jgi:hypothetical protein
MALMQRRATITFPFTNKAKPTPSKRLSVGYGDGRISPKTISPTSNSSSYQSDQQLQTPQAIRRSPSPSFSAATSAPTFDTSHLHSSNTKGSDGNNWFLKIVYAIAGLSWIVARITTGGESYYASVIADLESQVLATSLHMKHNMDGIRQIKAVLDEETKLSSNLSQTREALEHEVRMLYEMQDSKSKMTPKPNPGASESIVEGWLEHRLQGLNKKMSNLQHHLQASSRRTMAEK